MGRSGSEKGHVESTCDCGNEPAGSIKCGELAENRLASQEGLCTMVYEVWNIMA
jgi:hypothetical protein